MSENTEIVEAVDSSIADEYIIDVFRIPNSDYENGLSAYLISQHEEGEERCPDTVYAEDIYELIFDNLHFHSAGKYEYKVNVYEMDIDYLQDVSEDIGVGNIEAVNLGTSIEFIESIPVFITAEELEVTEKGITSKTHVKIDVMKPFDGHKGKSHSYTWTCGNCEELFPEEPKAVEA